jgi:hypothetical protein
MLIMQILREQPVGKFIAVYVPCLERDPHEVENLR